MAAVSFLAARYDEGWGDTLPVTKIDRLARSASDLYRIISELAEKGVAFKVVDDPTIDTASRTGKLVMGILALIAEFENDIRRERQMDGIAKAKERGTRFGRRCIDDASFHLTSLPPLANRSESKGPPSVIRALKDDPMSALGH